MPNMNQTPFSLALVTGASSGIGMALCHLLASKGISLIITGRDATRLVQLADELSTLVPVEFFTANLASSERCKIIEKIHERVPDLVINNAGFGLYGEALSYDTSMQTDMVEVNSKVVLEFTLESARALSTSNKKGVILNVSSAASGLIFPCFAVYAATKTFVTQVSISLDYEMQSRGIRVLASCPGIVETHFRSRASGIEDSSQERSSMSAEFAAKQIWRQIEKKQRVHVFDWKTRAALFLARCLPRTLLAKILMNRIESYLK